MSSKSPNDQAYMTDFKILIGQKVNVITDSGSSIAVPEKPSEIRKDYMKESTNKNNCKKDKGTLTHDKVGLIDNEEEKCDD